jgi:hypothetical protein
MDSWLLIGGGTTVVVAIVHSVLGEWLIFRRMREGTIVPTKGHPILRERHVRIIWATWHIVSVLGLGLAAILFYIAVPELVNVASFSIASVSLSMGVSSLLVLYATKGKHPGWIGLLIICVATWLAR